MQIKVIDVGTPNTHQSGNGLTYKSIEVIYKDQDEQILSKKLVSFADKELFNQAGGWTKGTNLIVKVDDTTRFKTWLSVTNLSTDIQNIPSDIPY